MPEAAREIKARAQALVSGLLGEVEKEAHCKSEEGGGASAACGGLWLGETLGVLLAEFGVKGLDGVF